jgi:hypothetical protein
LRRWEIGLDMMAIAGLQPVYLVDQEGAQFAFLVRKANQTNTHAFRLRLTPGFTMDRFADYPKLTKEQFYKIGIDVGIERRHKIGRFLTYYGTDLHFNRMLNSFTINSSFNPPPYSFFNRTERITSVGVSGLVGITYFLSARMAVSAENDILFSYNWNADTTRWIDENNQDTRASLSRRYTRSGIFLRRLPGVYLTYYF